MFPLFSRSMSKPRKKLAEADDKLKLFSLLAPFFSASSLPYSPTLSTEAILSYENVGGCLPYYKAVNSRRPYTSETVVVVFGRCMC
jgi:hypothetical protein